MPAVVLQLPAVDVCPICDAAGLDPCCEESGQTCLDHFGRPVNLPGGSDETTGNAEILAVA